MTEVQGTGKVNGKPVEEGAIDFEPVDGLTPTGGGIITNGQYSAKVPVGLMKVSIKSFKPGPSRKEYENDPNSRMISIKVQELPAKYNTETELQYEVKPGVNEKDWDLQTN
jgi:hypothetical protein